MSTYASQVTFFETPDRGYGAGYFDLAENMIGGDLRVTTSESGHTLSSVTLNREQVADVAEFLNEWLDRTRGWAA